MSSFVCDKQVHDIQNIQSYKPFILVIHANWCGACQQFAPNYNEFHEQQKSQNKHDQVVSIENDDLMNGTDSIYVKDEHGNVKDLKSLIYGFPTILGVDKNNKYTKYEGTRRPQDLQHFLKSLTTKTKRNSNSKSKSKSKSKTKTNKKSKTNKKTNKKTKGGFHYKSKSTSKSKSRTNKKSRK